MLLITPEDFKKLSPEQKDEYYMNIYKLVNSFGNQLSPRREKVRPLGLSLITYVIQ